MHISIILLVILSTVILNVFSIYDLMSMNKDKIPIFGVLKSVQIARNGLKMTTTITAQYAETDSYMKSLANMSKTKGAIVYYLR